MREQRETYVDGSQAQAVPQGFQMFKDHIAAMKRGSKLLGGEREKTDQQSPSGTEDK